MKFDNNDNRTLDENQLEIPQGQPLMPIGAAIGRGGSWELRSSGVREFGVRAAARRQASRQVSIAKGAETDPTSFSGSNRA